VHYLTELSNIQLLLLLFNSTFSFYESASTVGAAARATAAAQNASSAALVTSTQHTPRSGCAAVIR
jgi:hypothetical protein